VEPVLVEALVWSEDPRYAGRLDLVGDLADGSRWLLDYKTGATGIWPETSLQQTAYRFAQFYVDEQDQDQPMDALGIDGAGAVWIRPDNWELVPVKSDRAVLEVFHHALEVAAWTDMSKRASVLPTVPRPMAAS
jgi:hypothetical protein